LTPDTGVIHGDIKLENVLVFKNDKGWTTKLIDFGYSCLGTSEHDLVQVIGTRPWQAPENGDQYFTISGARRMDIYQFGILAARAMLSDVMPSTIGKFGKCKSRKEVEGLLQRIEEMKSSGELLDTVCKTLRECDTIPGEFKDRLEPVFQLTLQHDPSERCDGFANVLAVFTSGPDV
jgi:serine/threonine protein kinase